MTCRDVGRPHLPQSISNALVRCNNSVAVHNRPIKAQILSDSCPKLCLSVNFCVWSKPWGSTEFCSILRCNRHFCDNSPPNRCSSRPEGKAGITQGKVLLAVSTKRYAVNARQGCLFAVTARIVQLSGIINTQISSSILPRTGQASMPKAPNQCSREVLPASPPERPEGIPRISWSRGRAAALPGCLYGQSRQRDSTRPYFFGLVTSEASLLAVAPISLACSPKAWSCALMKSLCSCSTCWGSLALTRLEAKSSAAATFCSA